MANSGFGSLWARVAIALPIAAVAVSLYASVVPVMVREWWEDPGASYGFAIPPLAALLAWSRREEFTRCTSGMDGRGLVLVAAACVVRLGGAFGADYFTSRFSLILVLAGLVWLFRGGRCLRVLSAPLLLLATMIPLPAIAYARVAVPLQLLASEVATGVVQAAGGSVYRDGNILRLPNLTLGVAEACSGLNSLTAVAVVALLMAMTHCTRIWTRAALLAASFALAIAVNVTRVTGTALLAVSSERLALGFYHYFSGWVIFVICSILILYMAKGLHRAFES